MGAVLTEGPPRGAPPAPDPSPAPAAPPAPRRDPLPAPPGLRAHAGEAVLLLLVVALGCAFYASLAWYGFDLLEEGYFLTHARRVQLGGLPYRDFSTPYTPGVFYLYAWMMEALGADLVALRVLSVLARAVTFAGLYLCARRLMSPAFAAIAPLVLVVMDTAPELWGIHPGWITTAAALWPCWPSPATWTPGGWPAGWSPPGPSPGVAFAFKQNLAAYGLIAALWFLVVAERRLPPLERPLEAARPLPPARPRPAPGGAGGRPRPAAPHGGGDRPALLLRPGRHPLRAPPAGPLGRRRRRASCPTARGAPVSRGFLARPLLVLAGFGAVTLPWLVALDRGPGLADRPAGQLRGADRSHRLLLRDEALQHRARPPGRRGAPPGADRLRRRPGRPVGLAGAPPPCSPCSSWGAPRRCPPQVTTAGQEPWSTSARSRDACSPSASCGRTTGAPPGPRTT